MKLRNFNFNKDENDQLKSYITSLTNQNEQLTTQLSFYKNFFQKATSSPMQTVGSECPPQSQDSGMCVSENTIGKVSIEDSDEFTSNADSGVCNVYNEQIYEFSETKSESSANTKETDKSVTYTTVENNCNNDLVFPDNQANTLMMVQCGKPQVHKADEISMVGCEQSNLFSFKYQDPSNKTVIKVNNNSNEYPKVYQDYQTGKCESRQLANNNKSPVASYNEFVPAEKTSTASNRKEAVKLMQETIQIPKLHKKNSQNVQKSVPRLSKIKRSQKAPKLSESLQRELKRKFSLSPDDVVAKKSKNTRRMIKLVPRKKKKVTVVDAGLLKPVKLKAVLNLTDLRNDFKTLTANNLSRASLNKILKQA